MSQFQRHANSHVERLYLTQVSRVALGFSTFSTEEGSNSHPGQGIPQDISNTTKVL